MKRPLTLQIVLLSFFFVKASDASQDQNDDLFAYASLDADDDEYYYYTNYNAENTTINERWQADDPFFYYPKNDEMIQQLNADIKVDVESKNAIFESIRSISIDPIEVASAALFFLAGAVTSACCICVTLYYVKLQSLMRQYAGGTIIEARILKSDPNLIDAIEKEEEEDKRGLIHVDGSNGSEEHSVHGITEDDETTAASYRQMDTGSDESENDEGSKEYPSNDDNRVDAQEKNMKNAKFRFVQIRRGLLQRKTESLLRSEPQLVTAEKFHIRRNQAPKEHVRRHQQFRSVIEYETMRALESSKIRIHLVVMGEDVIIVEDNLSKKFHIKLCILPKHPMSGFPMGEVQRARGCLRHMIFIPCLLLGCALVAVCVYTMYAISFPMFVVFVVVLVVQVPLLTCCLGPSFDKVISSSYFDIGLEVSADDVAKNNSFDEKADSISFAA
jgi:hypothetical protein